MLFSVYFILCGFYIPVQNLVKSLDPSVCTHISNVNPAERIFVKFGLGKCYEKLSSRLDFSIKFDYFNDDRL